MRVGFGRKKEKNGGNGKKSLLMSIAAFLFYVGRVIMSLSNIHSHRISNICHNDSGFFCLFACHLSPTFSILSV